MGAGRGGGPLTVSAPRVGGGGGPGPGAHCVCVFGAQGETVQDGAPEEGSMRTGPARWPAEGGARGSPLAALKPTGRPALWRALKYEPIPRATDG